MMESPPKHCQTLGDFELTVVSDGIYHMDGGVLFGVVPKLLWQTKMPADQYNRVAVGLNSLLVRTGKHNVLIETGIGNKSTRTMASVVGRPAQLLENLRGAGVAPEEIHIVINSHLHFDHCGWNTVQEGGKILPTFPNAKYYAQEGEVARARLQHERDGISYISDNYDPLIESGQMQLLRGDQEIIPGISVRLFPGHTQNLQAVLVQSGGKTACYISDLIPTTAHLPLAWVSALDLNPLDSMESRKKFYAQAVAENWLTVFTHDDVTPLAHLDKNEKGKVVVRKP